MTEVLKKLKGTDAPVAVYHRNTNAFCAGRVREADDEFVLIECISPSGQFDGFCCLRIEEILKIDAGTRYLKNLAKVYRYYNEEIPPLKLSPKSVLEGFLDYVIKSKRLCTMEIGFEEFDELKGYLIARDWSLVEMRLVDESGAADGFTEFDFEEIVGFGIASSSEVYLETLARLNDGEFPDDGGREGTRKKKNSDKTILSFPNGK